MVAAFIASGVGGKWEVVFFVAGVLFRGVRVMVMILGLVVVAL